MPSKYVLYRRQSLAVPSNEVAVGAPALPLHYKIINKYDLKWNKYFILNFKFEATSPAILLPLSINMIEHEMGNSPKPADPMLLWLFHSKI